MNGTQHRSRVQFNPNEEDMADTGCIPESMDRCGNLEYEALSIEGMDGKAKKVRVPINDTPNRDCAMLPIDKLARKALPVCSGVLDYFPDAIAEVAKASVVGNKQHLNGQPLHWDKSKSTDEADALVRHLLERGTMDADGVRHSAKVAWRALALLQREIEKDRLTGAVK